MDLIDGILLSLSIVFIGVMLVRGDEIITFLRWRLSKSGREARKARRVLGTFYVILYNRQEGPQGDIKLMNFLRNSGVVPEPNSFVRHGGKLNAAIALLEKRAQVVPPEMLEKAAKESDSEQRAFMDIWYNKASCPAGRSFSSRKTTVHRGFKRNSGGASAVKTDAAPAGYLGRAPRRRSFRIPCS
jgi:hypothetical protein